MTVATELTKLQTNLGNSYSKVSDKGGTLPANQNFDNLSEAIDSIVGGDTIYLENHSGTTITEGQKVLCNLGTIETDTPTSFTHSTNSNFAPILFFDDNAFVTSDNSTGYMHTKVDGVWTSTTNSLFTQWGFGGVYTFHENEIISGAPNLGEVSNTGYIYTKTGRTSLPSGYQYIGEYNEVHYCINTSDYTVNVYDMDNNTVGSSVATLYTENYQYLIYGKIIGNKCLVANVGGTVNIYQIAADGTFTLLKTSVISGYPLYVTGLSAGRYLLVTDSKAAYKNSHSSPAGHLFCYQIKDDYALLQVSVPALQMFENTACFVSYDNRNNVLCVGTSDNAYFYQYVWNNGAYIYRNLNISLSSLPTNTNRYPYKVMMSLYQNAIAVVGYGNYVNIYRLQTASHRIVPNSVYQYNLETGFTGFATGETDGDGKYEVRTILPEVTEWSISTQYLSADEVNVYGGAE